jgi:hypothetical protein
MIKNELVQFLIAALYNNIDYHQFIMQSIASVCQTRTQLVAPFNHNYKVGSMQFLFFGNISDGNIFLFAV